MKLIQSIVGMRMWNVTLTDGAQLVTSKNAAPNATIGNDAADAVAFPPQNLHNQPLHFHLSIYFKSNSIKITPRNQKRHQNDTRMTPK